MPKPYVAALSLLYFAALGLCAIIARAAGNFVTDISQCPALTPRSPRSTSIQDVRPDEFEVIMALGDSVMAGCFAKGIQDDFLDNFDEWRGVSFAIGGDPDALTLPNLVGHYNSAVQGASVSHHGLEYCGGSICPIGSHGWNAPLDNLNAAQSGALASNLLHEINDYLIPQLAARNISSSSFKLLTLFVGSNDVCNGCADASSTGNADRFEANVRKALEALRGSVANVLVNVVGMLPLTEIYGLTKDQSYCRQLLGQSIPHVNILCSCMLLGGFLGEITREGMDILISQYNTRLQNIVRDYQALADPEFAVTWQPVNAPLSSYPIQALSNIDCFHPSTSGHAVFAAALWNRMTLDQESRAQQVPWEDSPLIRCLEEDDRVLTTAEL
ncbi:hypothetical protein AURDEDRAFT_115465, partial [Auricularia subglabra TFB-10046 SS5]